MRASTKQIAIVLALSAIANIAHAGDAAAGKAAATSCFSCHGAAGAGTASAPRLAGLANDQLVTKLQGYRSGTLKNPMMGMVAKKLSDEQIDNISAYFAALK